MVSLDKSVWRSNIGIVTQDVTLFDDTIENNITSWDKAKSNNKLHKAAKDAALDFIETLPEGFNTLIGEKGAKLSGGQKQRLSLARELYREPKVLLLDEVTSALDTKSEAAILESLKIFGWADDDFDNCTSAILIKDASKIYVLKGKMVETGGYLDLKTQPGSELSRMIAAKKFNSRSALPAWDQVPNRFTSSQRYFNEKHQKIFKKKTGFYRNLKGSFWVENDRLLKEVIEQKSIYSKMEPRNFCIICRAPLKNDFDLKAHNCCWQALR